MSQVSGNLITTGSRTFNLDSYKEENGKRVIYSFKVPRGLMERISDLNGRLVIIECLGDPIYLGDEGYRTQTCRYKCTFAEIISPSPYQ
jgi:hypothetical protein